MNIINEFEKLPEELQVFGAENLFYRIGLSQYNFNEEQTRSKFYNPLLVFVVIIQMVVRNIFLLITYKKQYSDEYYLYFGDFGHFIKALEFKQKYL